MRSITVLTESDLRSVVGLGMDELATVESVYPLITAGTAVMPPIMRIDVPEHNGEIDVKSAYLPGHPGIAVKLSSGFFDNPGRGLPSLGGMMVLLDAETGVPMAALFDNGYLTDVRTALAGAVAARHLSRQDSSTAAVIGAGVQARLQLEALTLVRHLREARVWARDPVRAQSFADAAARDLGFPVDVAGSVSHAVTGADIVVTTTPSTAPLVDESMLSPGTHVTAVGSDAEHKQELATSLVAAADLFVCDSIPQSRRLGELRAVQAAGLEVRAVELGSVVTGDAGRRSPEDRTVCDLTGTGAQDTAIAGLAVVRSRRAGLGATIDT
ncbi:MAG TPA: cyclodeaminase [Acidimicrobiia bacterium]|nr:cyclodeaminase [Acidimicrobiia bacterium]